MRASNSRSSDLSHLRAKARYVLTFKPGNAYLIYQSGPGLQILLASLCSYLLKSVTSTSHPLQSRGWVLLPVHLWPPGCYTWFSSLPSSSPHMFRNMTTLDSLRCVSIWLCLPYIYNKLSLPPYLGAIMSFPFLFMYFFIQCVQPCLFCLLLLFDCFVFRQGLCVGQADLWPPTNWSYSHVPPCATGFCFLPLFWFI